MREIIIGCANKKLKSNKINRNEHCFMIQPFITSMRYFKNIENVYFLSIGIFQLLTIEQIGLLPKYWSPTGPYSTIIPLLLCLLLEIGGDLYKWIMLFFQDYNRNNKKYRLWDYNHNKWIEKCNQDIYPGEVLALEKNQNIPMDILLIDFFTEIQSRHDYCKINLANLNGESYPVIVDKIGFELRLDDFRMGKIKIKSDNKQSIFDIDGTLTLRNGTILDFNHRCLLVNGANLLSEGCLGIVINCGMDCKLQDKKYNDNNKQNTIMNKISNFMMNTTIYLLISLVLGITIYKSFYNVELNVLNLLHFFHYFILCSIQTWIVLNGIIPFSIKILLSIFRGLESKKFGNGIKVNSPYLVDQYPFIDYILSDKTGTITKNVLELMKMIDCNQNIYCLDIHDKLLSKDLIRGLGLSISISDGTYQTPEDKTIHQRYLYLNSKITYVDNLVVLDIYGNIEEYIRYPTEGLGFNLLRPISSQIYLNKKTGEYFIFTKASINRLRQSLHINDQDKLINLDEKLTEIDNSLRILGLGYRKIDKDEILDYEARSITERQLFVENFEKDLNLIGLLGIQDSLIPNINHSIKWFLENNIGFGLLTGDRKITALAVSKNAGLIDEDTRVISLDNIDILRKLYLSNFSINYNKACLLFNNEFIEELILNREAQTIFIDILKAKPILVGYSLTPNGKKSVLDLVEISGQKTLAIGDGLNDIKMLSSANIGVALSENIDSYGDFVLDSFLRLEDCFKMGYHFSQRNQIISLMTMFKSCSIGFVLFWVLLYGDGISGLFDFFVHQGFHLVWCLIHPYMYVLLEKPNKSFLNIKTRNILDRFSMSFWIFIAGLESSLLMFYLKPFIFEKIFTSFAVFYLVIQINTMLFCFDYNLHSFLIQIFNLFLLGLYIHFGNIGIMYFINKLIESFIIEYFIIILFIQVSVVSIWRRYLKI
jgi:magnesium-transporting ATPase (P-type)